MPWMMASPAAHSTDDISSTQHLENVWCGFAFILHEFMTAFKTTRTQNIWAAWSSRRCIPELSLQQQPFIHFFFLFCRIVLWRLCRLAQQIKTCKIHDFYFQMHAHAHSYMNGNHPYSISLPEYIIAGPLPPPQRDRDRLRQPLIAAVATVMGNGAAHLHLLILLLWLIFQATRKLFYG